MYKAKADRQWGFPELISFLFILDGEESNVLKRAVLLVNI